MLCPRTVCRITLLAALCPDLTRTPFLTRGLATLPGQGAEVTVFWVRLASY